MPGGDLSRLIPDTSHEAFKTLLSQVTEGLTAHEGESIDLSLSSYKEIGYLCSTFKIKRVGAFRLLTVLKVPLLHLGKQSYFNAVAFECILFVLTKYGSSGFAAPGSTFKNHCKHVAAGVPTEITDAILQEAASPRTLLEMLAAQTRDRVIVRELIRTTQKEKEEQPENEPRE